MKLSPQQRILLNINGRQYTIGIIDRIRNKLSILPLVQVVFKRFGYNGSNKLKQMIAKNMKLDNSLQVTNPNDNNIRDLKIISKNFLQ